MSFLAAVEFLTVLPLPRRWRSDHAHLARSARWYPLVGLLLGLALAGLDWLVGLALTSPARDAVTIALAVGLSGALHLDGLMDTADGVLAAVEPARRLEIMRDSHVGSFGVAGGALALLGKLAALLSLGDAPRWLALVLMAMLGRWAMALTIATLPAGRSEGLGRLVKDGTGPGDLVLAAALVIVACVLLAPGAALLTLGAVTVTSLAAACLLLRRLPGLTGDAYGAINELAELAALALLPLCWRLASP